jgi:FSR family fosmidomycin resistance protein-like MFS transporter
MTIPAETRVHDSTVYPIIAAIAVCHLLNDLMQSLIPAIYPILKTNLALTFTQIGLIGLVFQGVASVLQPLVGLYTDRHPLPYALASAMAFTLAGLVLLAHAGGFPVVLLAVALIGIGSSIFHPEASRIARLAAGMRPGFAQSVFQVGGNFGSSLGPLAAVYIVLPNGQTSIEWIAGVALVGMVILTLVGRWFVQEGALRAQAGRKRAATATAVHPGRVRIAVAVLILLMFSKFVYMTSFSSYYTFYLIERFGTDVRQSQNLLFIFLVAVAVGTIIGGPIGDRIGRKRVIWLSILGVLPLSLVLPHVGLYATVAVSALAGLMLASAFPAIIVYAQDLMPTRTGSVAGLFFGLAFGMGAMGAAVLGFVADRQGIVFVYHLCAWLPLIGVLAVFLPNLRDPRRAAV